MSITDVNSRRETPDSRYASIRKDANNSTGISRDANSSREARNSMDSSYADFREKLVRVTKICEKV